MYQWCFCVPHLAAHRLTNNDVNVFWSGVLNCYLKTCPPVIMFSFPPAPLPPLKKKKKKKGYE